MHGNGRFAVCVACAMMMACGGVAASVKAPTMVSATPAQRPAWVSSVPPSTDDVGYVVANATADTEPSSRDRAMAQAARQVIERYFGVHIESAVYDGQWQSHRDDGASRGVDQADGAVTAIGEFVSSQISSTSRGHIRGLEMKGFYTEYWRVPKAGSIPADSYRTWTLGELDPKVMEEEVRRWVFKSPVMVEREKIKRQAESLMADMERTVREGGAAADSGHMLGLEGHVKHAADVQAELDAAASRHQVLLGLRLPVDHERARKAAEGLRTRWAAVLGALRVGYGATVEGDTVQRAAQARGMVGAILSAASLPAEEVRRGRCAGKTTHWVWLTVNRPVCTHPGMGIHCELPLTFEIGACPSASALDSDKVQGLMTRGASTQGQAAAIDRAWHKISKPGPEDVALRDAFLRVLRRHFPLEALQGAP